MKILFLSMNLEVAGAERQILELLRAWPEMDSRPEVLLLEGCGAWLDDARALTEVRAVSSSRPRRGLGKKLLWALSVLPRLRKELHRADTVVTFLWLPALLACMTAPFFRRRPVLVYSVQANLAANLSGRGGSLIARMLVRVLFVKRISLFIVPSEALDTGLRDFFGRAELATAIIPNAVAARPLARKPPTIPTIAAVGRLHPSKGYDVLIEACRKLKERGLRFQCRIAGEGPERGRLEEQIKGGALEDVIALEGFIAEPREVLAQADIYVSSSNWETFGMAIAEAMGAGIPVAATATDGARELIADGASGLLVPVGDSAALASALERLLGDPELRARLGAAANDSTRKYLPAEIARRYKEALDAHSFHAAAETASLRAESSSNATS